MLEPSAPSNVSRNFCDSVQGFVNSLSSMLNNKWARWEVKQRGRQGGREKRRGRLRQSRKVESCGSRGKAAELSAFMICLSECVKTNCQPPITCATSWICLRG